MPGQRVVAGRAVQPERVPAVPPVVADPLVGVEDHEGQPALGEVVAGRQARLAGADDDRVDLFVSVVRHRLTCRSARPGSEATGIARSPCTNAMAAAAGRASAEYPIRSRAGHGYLGQTRQSCS